LQSSVGAPGMEGNPEIIAMSVHAPTGLSHMAEVPWGSHLCQFFANGADLRETLVPYFKAGLENNERCLMVAMAPFGVEDARSALRAEVADFDRRERARQIEIHDVRAWYNSDTVINGDEIVAGLVASEEQARVDGYNGFRTHGNIGWLGRNQWKDFQDYETGVTRGLKGRRMISMCSYCLDSCAADDVLDVVTRHGLVVTKRNGGLSCLAVTPYEFDCRSTQQDAATTATGQQFRAILEAIPAAVYTTDKNGYLTYFNEVAVKLWGRRPEIGKQRWSGAFRISMFDETLVPDDQCPMAQVLRTGKPAYNIEAYIERPDGARIPCAFFPTPIFDEDGSVIGGVDMLVDISRQKALQEQQSILVRELDHRIKNNLATIQAIAGTTIRNARSLDDFQDAFSGRIAALSKTHSLLTDNAQQHVPLRQLLNNELEIHDDGGDQRISLSGPDVDLPAHFAVSYGMSIHELTTNALKYGALSTLGGRLKVNWTLEGSSLNLKWEESNVPIAGPPTRVGFGTQLLRRLLPHQLGAKVDMAFEPDGLKAEISAKIA
jgi:PAS domain S-box-containing protein